MSGLTHELTFATALAREAGALLMRHRAAGFAVEQKTSADDLVTAADREASALIVSRLHAEFPEDGLLSEEEADSPQRLTRQRVWIIDPIDGTREFVDGSADFCVSIGLVVAGEAVLGVVYAPATDELFAGMVGGSLSKNGQPAGFSHRTDFVVNVSDTEYGRELHRTDLPGMVPSGSIALKLARIAAGEADVTFSMSPRSEWDICAGDALLRLQGGELRRRDGQPIVYNSVRPHIEQGIIGGSKEALAWLEGELLARHLPTVHLNLTPVHPAWTLLSEEQQRQWQGHPGVCIRYSGQNLLALLVVNPETRLVEAQQGDAHHLERLTRDVIRALGTLA